jgi:hypothetical protein
VELKPTRVPFNPLSLVLAPSSFVEGNLPNRDLLGSGTHPKDWVKMVGELCHMLSL